MAGLFDDLIPAPQAIPVAPSATGGGMFDDLVPVRGDRLPMAAGAVPHDMPADTISGGPTPQPPTVGQDIANSTGSRLVAGTLDIPGAAGDARDLAKGGADLAASPLVNGIRWIMGKPPLTAEQTAGMRQFANANEGSTPLDLAPTSQGVKSAVGFQPYQPQTGAGKVYDKWAGAGIELAPSVLATGGSALLKKAAADGIGAAVAQAGKDVAKQAIVPGAAGEAAGEVTQGTAAEPYARAAAAIVTGAKMAGGREAVSKAAPDADALQKAAAALKAASQADYAKLANAGMTVHPAAYDAAIDDIAKAAGNSGIRPSSSPIQAIAPSMTPSGAQRALDELIASKGTPKTWEQLDQLHQQASQAAKSLDPAERRMGAIIAQHIDGLMGGLQFGQVSFTPKPGTPVISPADAFQTLINARSQWRQMRNSERVAGLIEQAKDRVGANYTSAGFQTALRQVFKSFKGQNKMGVSKDFQMLDPDSQAVVNSIIRGAPVENALRMAGKMHAWAGAFLGHTFGGPVGAVGLPIASSLARSASARQTFGKVNRLGGLVSGTPTKVKRAAGSAPFAPMSVFYSLAAQNAAQQAKERGQQAGQ